MVEKFPEEPAAQNFPLIGSVLHLLGLVAFERNDRRVYVLLSPSRDWLASLLNTEPLAGEEFSLVGRFEFLDHFLNDSEEIWRNSDSKWHKSGVWTEKTSSGEEFHLEATAAKVDGRQLLLLENLTGKYQERAELLQKARENVLNYQRLVREIEGNEILLHCIVHDLSGPLMGVETCLSWFEREELSDRGMKRLQTGRKAAAKLRALSEEILAVFAAEQSVSVRPGEDSPSICALSTVRTVVEILQPAARLKNTEIEIQVSGHHQDWTVVGERARLERVLFNLLDNALRHSPQNSRVLLRLSAQEGETEVSVEDEGPGVPVWLEPQLFKKFLRGQEGAGKIGLGLYFCRIVVERWGGRIGYRSRSPKGSRFWFCLPRAKAKSETRDSGASKYDR